MPNSRGNNSNDDDNNVQISEIFTSIEGEGIFFGTKTMFIRFSGCHLKCYWCDTTYALPMNSGETYSIDKAKKLIEKNIQPNIYKVNFTGGEPLIQYKALKELAKFVKERKNLTTYIESSCYDSNRFNEILQYIDICKIEFKTIDSNAVDAIHYDKLLKNELECLRLGLEKNKVTYIKIVISDSTKIIEFEDMIEKIFKNLNNIEKKLAGFIIQPTSKINEPTVEKCLEFYDKVYPFYKEVRVIPQLHKVIIGAR